MRRSHGGGGGGSIITWAGDLDGSSDTSQTVVTLTGTGNLVTVPATTNIRFGTSGVPTTGRIRLPNASAIVSISGDGTEALPLMNISAAADPEIEFGKYNPTKNTALYFYAGTTGSGVNFYAGVNAIFAATSTYSRFLTTRIDWRPAGTSTYPATSDRVTVQTTNATATTLFSNTQDDTCVCKYTAEVTGFEPATGDSFSENIEATFKRNGGAATAVGAVVKSNRQEDAGATAWAITFDTSTNDVRLRVTGEASHTINWRATVSVSKG